MKPVPAACGECSVTEGWVPCDHGAASMKGRPARIAFLERKKVATKADLLMKFEDDDYHGVADAAMDLRDIVSELAGLRF
jgi:hypothetical protein